MFSITKKVAIAGLTASAVMAAGISGPLFAQGASADNPASGPTQGERYVPGVWVDPDGCEHWVMDDGTEGFMTPNVLPNGKPVCQRGRTCLVANSDQFFAVASADVSESGRKTLADFFKAQSGVSFVVEGHTDSDGSDAYNLGLSTQRAHAVRKIALANGAKSIETRGYGERKPIASNKTVAGKSKNRRVEIQCVGGAS